MERRVYETIWNWRENTAGKSQVPSESAYLRRKAVLQAVIMGIVGILLHFGLHHRLFALIVWILAASILMLGLLVPRAYRPIHRFGTWLGWVVGVALLYILLVPFFYLFFFPVSLLLKIQGRDPMHRGMSPVGLTYWIPRRFPTDPKQYKLQFLREDKEARELQRPLDGDGTGGGHQ